MSKKTANNDISRHCTDAIRREQALCVDALASGEFDEMSDKEWVALCERVARDALAENETEDPHDGVHAPREDLSEAS